MDTKEPVQRLVLLVDDETMPSDLYVRALERVGFKVEQRFDPDEALAFVEKEGQNIKAIILDVMMPPGSYGNKRTEDGLTTGVLLYADLQQRCPYVPIFVTTNTANHATLQQFPQGPLLRIIQKIDYPPRALIKLVQEMIDKEDANDVE